MRHLLELCFAHLLAIDRGHFTGKIKVLRYSRAVAERVYNPLILGIVQADKSVPLVRAAAIDKKGPVGAQSLYKPPRFFDNTLWNAL